MMRYLTSDEVRELDKFLIDGNDEAVGIEIHIGKEWRTGYSEPDTIQKFTLSELEGKEPIEIGRVKVCALAGDQLYCIEKGKYSDEVHSTGTEYAYRGVSPDTGDYMYVRVMVTYCCPIVTLPDDEILSLDTFLVKGNDRVVGVRFEPGSSGIGGSNSSGFSADSGKEYEYTVDELGTKKPFCIEEDVLCALVNDVLYLRYRNRNGDMRVYTLDYRKRSLVTTGDSIAYDTVSATRITLILKDR